jgi:hypothetical protein
MATEKQQLANRRNAQASTGPKTEAGRAMSSKNSLKHGLTAEQIILDDEDPADFAAFHQSSLETFEPVGALEEQLVERITFCGWRLRRVYRTEARLHSSEKVAAGVDFLASQLNQSDRLDMLLEESPLSEKDADKLRQVLRNEITATSNAIHESKEFAAFSNIGSIFQVLRNTSPMDRLIRYEASLDRAFDRAVRNLERVQARRKSEAAAKVQKYQTWKDGHPSDPYLVAASGVLVPTVRAPETKEEFNRRTREEMDI